jgi:hypothetical protein
MGVHVEYTIASGNRLRTGVHDSVEDAMQSFERLAEKDPSLAAAAVYDQTISTSAQHGRLVAVRTEDGDWIRSTDQFAAPDWWQKFDPSTQSSLINHAGEKLSAEEVVAVTHARGIGPTAAKFIGDGASPDEYFLDRHTTEWLRARAVLSTF